MSIGWSVYVLGNNGQLASVITFNVQNKVFTIQNISGTYVIMIFFSPTPVTILMSIYKTLRA